jgi:hypothetical protein
MLRQNKKLADKVINVWPEIFGEVVINELPLYYVDAVLLNFKNGKCWEISIPEKTRHTTLAEFEGSINELMSSYEKSIQKVEVRIDTDKIKEDVEYAVNNLLTKLAY